MSDVIKYFRITQNTDFCYAGDEVRRRDDGVFEVQPDGLKNATLANYAECHPLPIPPDSLKIYPIPIGTVVRTVHGGWNFFKLNEIGGDCA